jgi:hypothetical protein
MPKHSLNLEKEQILPLAAQNSANMNSYLSILACWLLGVCLTQLGNKFDLDNRNPNSQEVSVGPWEHFSF